MKWIDKEAPKTAMANLNIISGVTLWEEMVRDRREFCLEKCQNNKVVNMLRPKCTDRRYLDVLLLKREAKKNIPLFCYSQRIKGLSRSFHEGETLLSDVYIYIDDYWRIIREKQSKSRSASGFLKRTLIKSKEVLPMGSMDQIIETHYHRGQIFLLWPKLDLCLVNAQETAIHSLKMFQSILETLTESYGLTVNIDVDGNFVETKFEELTLKDPNTVEKELQKSSYFTGFSESEIWAEIQLNSGLEEDEVEFKVKDLHFIVKTVADIIELTGEEEKTDNFEADITSLSSSSVELDKKTKS